MHLLICSDKGLTSSAKNTIKSAVIGARGSPRAQQPRAPGRPFPAGMCTAHGRDVLPTPGMAAHLQPFRCCAERIYFLSAFLLQS